MRFSTLLMLLLPLVLLSSTAHPQPAVPPLVQLDRLPAISGLPGSPALGTISALAFTMEGDLLLLEAANQRLLRIGRDGRYVGEAGGFGFGEGALRGATDLAVAGFEIWIADPLAGRLVRYDSWLAPLTPWTAVADGNRDQPFVQPRSVALLPSGDAVILDADTPELLLVDPDGRLLERVGRVGELNGGFIDPRRVAVGEDGSILVADPGREELLRFDRFGSPRGRWPWTGPGEGPRGMAAAGSSWWVVGANELQRLDSRGQPQQRWTAAELGFSSGELTDVAVGGDRLAVTCGAQVRWFRARTDDGE